MCSYIEESKRWEGPFTLSRIEGKTAYIKGSRLREHPFAVTHIKEFQLPAIAEPDSHESSGYFTKIVDYHKLSEEEKSKFIVPMKQELDGIIVFDALEIVNPNDLPTDANILNSRFFFAIKDPGEKNERYKARLVVQDHKDSEKEVIVRDAPTGMRYSDCIFLAFSALFELIFIQET